MQDDGMSMARDGIRQRADRVTRLDFSRQGFIRKPNQHRIIHSPLHILCTFTSAHRIRTMGWKDTDSRQKPLLDNRMPRARRPHTTCRTPSSVRCECHKPTSEADEDTYSEKGNPWHRKAATHSYEDDDGRQRKKKTAPRSLAGNRLLKT